MEDPALVQLLESHAVKPTAIRLLVLRTMKRLDQALSLTDLEALLGTVDKSSIFRTLTLFLAHHLVHCVEDGSGFTKYALCDAHCHCGTEEDDGFTDHHTHFLCTCCGRTFCLRGLQVPKVAVPEGFVLRAANYVLKGLCPECAQKGRHACESQNKTR